MMSQCRICRAFHNHFSCPYCGTVEVSKQTFDLVNNMIPIQRALPVKRELRLAVSKQVIRRTYARLLAKV